MCKLYVVCSMSTNANENTNSVKETIDTMGMDGKTVNRYVKSQQVNLPNSTDHEITFSINPTIEIPVKGANDVVGDYVNPINQTLGEYSVYENNELWIENVPAGLQYATLNFDKIDISEHTEVRIESYTAGKKNDPNHLLGTTPLLLSSST